MQSTFSIGGLASGLDTTSIIQQLMQIERQPVVRYQQRQDQLRSVDQAWGEVVSKMSGLRTAVDGVRRASSWSGFAAATSSNEEAVEVTASGSAEPSSLSFTIKQLATRHQVVGATSYGALTDLVGEGTVVISKDDGTEVSITTDANTTVADLVKQIDAEGAGVVDAQAVKVSDAEYRLLLSATTTGAAATFQVTGPEAFTTTQEGVDAELIAGGLTLKRGSNTITDLVEGATIELKQPTTSAVTVTMDRDVTKAADAVEKLVDAANEVLATLSKHTAYNADSKTAGPLQGDSLARKLTSDLRGLVSGTVGGGDVDHGSQVGISLTRTGQITLDRSKLEGALRSDFDAVAGFFGQSFEGPQGTAFVAATSATRAGTYDVQINAAATVAAATGSSFSPPADDLQPKIFKLTTTDGKSISVTIDTSVTSAAGARAKIEAALRDADIEDVEVSDEGDAVTFSSTRYGSQHGFDIEDADGLFTWDTTTARGTDVEGSIGDSTTTGSGRTLRAIDGDAEGLQLSYSGTDTGAIGAASFSGGLGGLLDGFLKVSEGTAGTIQGARDAIAGRIRRFDDQIDAYEVRLELRETALRRQFAALESAMGTLTSQGNWLASQIAGLNGGQG